MALQENEKILTTVNAAGVFAQIKADIAAIDTSIYVTNEALDAKGFITGVPEEYVTENELTAKGFLTAVPEEYITEEELAAKGFITEIPAVDLPVATSDEILALYTGGAQA